MAAPREARHRTLPLRTPHTGAAAILPPGPAGRRAARAARSPAGAGPRCAAISAGRSWAAPGQAMAAAGALSAAAARLGHAMAAAPEARLESVRGLAGLFREAQPR